MCDINKLKLWWSEFSCSHKWKYWDLVADVRTHEIRLNNKFRKCEKCSKRMKKITTPNNWGRFIKTDNKWDERYSVVGKVKPSEIEKVKREESLKKIIGV